MRMQNKPIRAPKDPTRKPELPDDWVEEYDQKVKKMRNDQLRDKLRKLKKDRVQNQMKLEEQKRGF